MCGDNRRNESNEVSQQPSRVVHRLLLDRSILSVFLKHSLSQCPAWTLLLLAVSHPFSHSLVLSCDSFSIKSLIGGAGEVEVVVLLSFVAILLDENPLLFYCRVCLSVCVLSDVFVWFEF